MNVVWEELQGAILGVLNKYDLSMVTSKDAPVPLPTRARPAKRATRKPADRRPKPQDQVA